MNNLSHWERDLMLQSADVAVIGSGFVGSFSALFLARARPDLRIVVFDRDLSCGGASSRNAGFACFGSISEVLTSIDQHSEAEVQSIIKDRYLGLELMKKTLGIDHMNYEPCGGYEVFTTEDEILFDRCADYLPKLNQFCRDSLGISDTYQIASNRLNKIGLKSFTHSIYNAYEGSIHPAKSLNRLHNLCREAGISMIDHANISQLTTDEEGVRIVLNDNLNAHFSKVILATNGFTADFMPRIQDIKPARNMVLVTHPIPDLKLKGTFHFDGGYVYFRNIGNRILLGGARNHDLQSEYTSQYGLNTKIQSHLTRFLLDRLLPGYDEGCIAHWWSGIMGVGETLQPEVTWYDEHILTGIRLNGMGVALSSLVGKKISDKMNLCL